MRTIPVSELIEDHDLYPRAFPDDDHIAYLVDALQAGATFPAIVIEHETNRIVDGWHRCRAYTEAFGALHPVECIEKNYESDAELFLDAVHYNAAHGNRLLQDDRKHIIETADRLSIPTDLIAGALLMPMDRIGALRPTLAPSLLTNAVTVAKPHTTPFGAWNRSEIGRRKGSQFGKTAHAGQAEQAESRIIEHGGTSDFESCANQLIRFIEAKAWDAENIDLKRKCAKLHLLLERVIAG